MQKTHFEIQQNRVWGWNLKARSVPDDVAKFIPFLFFAQRIVPAICLVLVMWFVASARSLQSKLLESWPAFCASVKVRFRSLNLPKLVGLKSQTLSRTAHSFPKREWVSKHGLFLDSQTQKKSWKSFNQRGHRIPAYTNEDKGSKRAWC